MFAIFLSALSETHVSYAYQKCQFSYSDLNYSIEMRLDKLSLYLIEKDTFYAFSVTFHSYFSE